MFTRKPVGNVLSEAYEIGQCKIEPRSIGTFRNEACDDRWGQPSEFVRVLQDPRSNAAKTLRSLTKTECELYAAEEVIAGAYVDMLATNRTLEHLPIEGSSRIFASHSTALKHTDGLRRSKRTEFFVTQFDH